jgi:holo-[acyl-carrier protein] synthase
MRILGHGIDVVDVGRIDKLLSALEEDFLLGTFTHAERRIECQPHERAAFFSGRLAAKEAVVKALGTGFTGAVSWQHVEILRRDDGRPYVNLRAAAKDRAGLLGVSDWLLSISHTEAVAVASAIAVG